MKHSSKKFLFILLACTALALIIRLVVAYGLYSFNYGRNPVQIPTASTDMATYMELAKKIASGEYKEGFYYQPFYYAVFLPLIRLVSGGSLLAMVTVQALLGAATIYLAGLSGAAIGGKRCGYITAVMLVFCGILIAYTPYHLIATLQAFWVILLFYMTIKSMERRKWYFWLLTGLIAGCGILTRGNIWFFVPGIIIAACYSEFKRTSSEAPREKLNFSAILKKLVPALLLILFILLPQVPFALRNTELQGRLTGPSTAAGAVLSLGNTPEAPPGGREPEHLAGAMEYPPTYNVWMSNSDKVTIPARIWNWFKQEPLAFCELMFRKSLLFWDHREIPNNVSYLQIRVQCPFLKAGGFVEAGFIIAFAIAGMILMLPGIFRHRKLLLLYYFVAAYCAATALFYILSRFRAPVLPLLAVFAALAIEWVIRRRKRPLGKVMGPLGGALLVGVFVCYFSFDFYRIYIEPGIMRMARPNGVVVQVSDNEDMYLDNGPMTFGGWQFLELEPGVSVGKHFAIPDDKQYKTAKVVIPLISQTPGTVVIAVNGKQEYLTFETAGMKLFTFYLSVPESRDLRLQGVSGNVFCLLDFQRNYSRTMVGDSKSESELVARIYCGK